MDSEFNHSSIKIMTFNMHGFNQGESLLNDVCSKNLYDVIFVQEHWLSSTTLSKFNIFNTYSSFGISAMSESCSNGILFGRPFGGVLSMVNNNISNLVTPILIKDRIVILKINEYIFINVYLPCKDNSGTYVELLFEILSDISNTIDNLSYTGIFLGGDLNNNLSNNKEASCIIKNFLSSYDMSYIDLMTFNSCESYTYSNVSKGCYSIIDYICVSSSLLNYVVHYDTVCNAFNFSDHEPVELYIRLPVIMNASSNNSSIEIDDASVNSVTSMHVQNRFRFDHGNTAAYYDYSRILIEPIYNDLISIYNNLDYNHNIEEICSHDKIEQCYNNIVAALLQAGYATIPYTKVNTYKHWWDDELDILKQNCILSHDEWKSKGKPRNGPIFEKRNLDKKCYRSMILLRKSQSKQEISNSLLHSLYQGNGAKFWQTWKSKALNNQQVTPKIKGAKSEASACQIFKSYFDKLYNNNDNDFDNSMYNNYHALLKQRSKHAASINSTELNRELYNTVLIDIAVNKLNNSKAVGIDGLQKEHLVHAHPLLYTTLSKLFYIMMVKSYVPKQFGSGIIVTIQKDTSIKGVQSPENFRGITLSPLIAKIFEHCILFLYGKSFTSNDRQFGFKANLGCVHAIYCVRNVIEFFNRNQSTVNVCFLDVSKAFDRLSHHCLFFKLLKLSVPLCVINILYNWYSKLNARVKFGNYISQAFNISCGIRQGSVLSPTLFNVYVDNILSRLSPHGCRMNDTCYGSFMYADDLVLLSPSITELTNMVNIVCKELASVGLKLNCDKSCCLRIGPRHKNVCSPISTTFGLIPWSSEAKYLGVSIVSHCNFKVCFNEKKCKFYSAFNGLYCKLGNTLDLNVITHLLKAQAQPILMYGLEALDLNKSSRNSLDFSFSRAIYKIFKVNDSLNRQICMNMFNLESISALYEHRKNSFCQGIKVINNLYLKNVLLIS